MSSYERQQNDKTFSIGDGMKTICVPHHYSAELQDDNETLLLYSPENDDIWIRISVVTVENEDKTETSMFDYVINLAKEQGKEFVIVDDKTYTLEVRQSEENGDQIVTYHFEIGYKSHIIFISVTTFLQTSATERFQSVLTEMPEYISSIKEISEEQHNRFSLTSNDYRLIRKRSSGILDISEDELSDFHESDKTPKTIQRILNEKKYRESNTTELQSLGIAFGDYIQHKYPNFQWSIVHDQFGRDFCLNYEKTAIDIFPQTMISKRVEYGEEFDVEELLSGIIHTVGHLTENQ